MEKVFAGLLVILIPLGVVLSRHQPRLIKADLPREPIASPSGTLSSLDQVAVSYASSSGFLTISGVSPQAKSALFCNYTFFPKRNTIPEIEGISSASNDTQPVTAVATQPKLNGEWELKIVVPMNTERFEARIEQDSWEKALNYTF